MGRPINNKFFGPDDPDTFQIIGNAFLPNGTMQDIEQVYIIKQKSSRKFLVQSVANDPGSSGDMAVVITVNSDTPASGELSIPVSPSDGMDGFLPTEYVKTMSGKKMRTFNNNVYIWSSFTNDELGEALPGVDGTAAAEYLFRATFTASDRSFSDDQIIETTADGIEDGRLQFILNGGTDSADIVSNELEVVGAAFGPDLSGIVCPCAIPRTKPLAAIFHFSSSPAYRNGEVGWQWKFATASNLTSTYHYAFFQPWEDSDSLYIGSGLTCIGGTQVESTEMEVCIILGGFDSNGIPWDGVSDVKDYLHGSQYCQWNGSAWEILFVSTVDNENLSPYFDFRDGNDATLTNLVVPDANYQAALVPSSHTISISNDDTGTHDANGVISYNISTAPTTQCDFSFRRIDDDNRWYVRRDNTGNLTLRKVDGGTDTLEGSGTAAVSTAEPLSIKCNGNTITVFSETDFNSKRRQIHITDAFNNTATGWKIELDSAVVDYICSHPVTHTVVPDTDNLPAAAAKNPSSASIDIGVFVGDSMLNSDTLSRQSVPVLYQQLIGGNETVYDDSLGGAIISQIVTRMTTISRPRMVIGNNDLHILVGTNNLYTSGQSAAVVTSELESLIDDELAYDPEGDGSKIWNNIFWYPIADRQQGGGAITPAEHTTRRNTINANIASTYSSEPRVHIVEWLDDRTLTDNNGVETTLRGFADSTNTEYGNGDDVHPNYIGNGMIAEHGYRVKKTL